jgi:hypothetical protein
LFASHALFSSLLFSSLGGFFVWFRASSFHELFYLRSQSFLWFYLSSIVYEYLLEMLFLFCVRRSIVSLARQDQRRSEKGGLWNMCKRYRNISAVWMCNLEKLHVLVRNFVICNMDVQIMILWELFQLVQLWNSWGKSLIHRRFPCLIEDEAGHCPNWSIQRNQTVEPDTMWC